MPVKLLEKRLLVAKQDSLRAGLATAGITLVLRAFCFIEKREGLSEKTSQQQRGSLLYF